MSTSETQLETEFHIRMLWTLEEGVNRGCYPTDVLLMLHHYGGVETAKRMLAKREIPTGLIRIRRLDLPLDSVEHLVIEEQYAPLFTKEERIEAYRRLVELAYFRPRW